MSVIRPLNPKANVTDNTDCWRSTLSLYIIKKKQITIIGIINTRGWKKQDIFFNVYYLRDNVLLLFFIFIKPVY